MDSLLSFDRFDSLKQFIAKYLPCHFVAACQAQRYIAAISIVHIFIYSTYMYFYIYLCVYIIYYIELRL